MVVLRAACVISVVAVAGCGPSQPAGQTLPPRASASADVPRTPPPPDLHRRLADLCRATKDAFTEAPPRRVPTRDAPEPELARALGKRLRVLVPAHLRELDPPVHVAQPVRGGHLVEYETPDPESESGSGTSFRLAFVPTKGAPRLLVDEVVLDTADFDGDGEDEPITRRCTPKPLFARECTMTVWFSAREVSFTRFLQRGVDIQPYVANGRAFARIVPADGVAEDFFTADETTIVTFAPSGATTSNASATRAADAARAKARYALEACEEQPRELDPARWERRLRALGAGERELAPLAQIVIAKRLATSAVPPPNPDDPVTTRDILAKLVPERDDDAAVWAALPKPATRCPTLSPQVREAFRQQHDARVRRRADERFADMIVPVEATFGCTTREGTLALVTWAEAATLEPTWTTELHLVPPSPDAGAVRSEVIASTRSQWFAEYHHIYDLMLGPSGDFDGDGEDETLILGIEHEVGSGGRSRIAAVRKNGAFHSVPRAIGIHVAALDAKRAAVVLTNGTYLGKDKLWPPKVLTLGKGGFRPAGVPQAWTVATREARAALARER